MQVATFFQDNATLIGSAMNSAPELSYISIEEKEEKIDEAPNKDNNIRTNNLSLSVSSLVNLASSVLNGGDVFIKRKNDPRYNEFIKKTEEENQIQSQNVPIQCEKYSETLCNESSKGDKVESNQTCSTLSTDIEDHPTNVINRPISPRLGCSTGTKEVHSLYKYSLNGSDDIKNVSSSHVKVSFEDNPTNFNNTFSIQTSEGSEIQTSLHSSSIIASNIRETNGCVTKVSDMDKIEAENLVIHEQDHINKLPTRTSENELDINQLLNTSKNRQVNKDQTDVTEVQGEADQPQLITQIQTGEEQDQNKCAKSSNYSNHHSFSECMKSDDNVEDLSNQNHQQISESQIDGIEKMLHIPTNINLNSHIDVLHPYHLHESQDHMQHQQTQQFFGNDQQHLMHPHRHQQHHHHSDLMAFFHQDQTAMQQPHHMRTYQHFQHQQQQRIHQLSYPQTSSPQQSHKHGHLTCIDDLIIDEFHEDANNRYKMLSPTVKHESQDDGYETCAGDVLTPNSHSSSHSMTPQHQIHSVNLLRSKCDTITPSHQSDQDPYHYMDDEINSNIRIVSPASNGVPVIIQQHNYESSPDVATGIRMENQHLVDTNNTVAMQSSKMHDIQCDAQLPKKRGRKKKCNEDISERSMIDSNLKPVLQKERKKHDRFNGMPEEEVSKRTLPDHLANNLDIIIIGINPGLFAAYKGHHYAGPGNHFWKCLYLSGLTHEQMTAEEDYKLLKIGIGFTNMVERATKGSADLTRKEIKEGSRILLEKLKRFRPKIAVFNGKLIFEVFSGKKDFNFGRQQECVEGTDTYMWVMPSSSARCAQLPRAADKVPFYAALKKFRDYLNGLIPNIDDLECVFNDPKSKVCCEPDAKGRSLSLCTHFVTPGCLNNEKELGCDHSPKNGIIDGNTISGLTANRNNNNDIQGETSPISVVSSAENNAVCNLILQGLNSVNDINPCNNASTTVSNTGLPEKKKRGRPKKIKIIDGGEDSIPHKIRNTTSVPTNGNNILNLSLIGAQGETPKKKRGRPKKIKIDNALTLKSDQITNNGNNKSGQVLGTNSLNNDDNTTSNAKIVCGNRCSPNNNESHHMLTMNTCTQYNTQSMSRPQPLQNQRLFTSPLHSPDTASSYCSIGINVTTPPTANLSNTNLNNNGNYHQHLGNSVVSHHPHNHILQRAPHQLHTVPSIYLQSPNETQPHRSKSPHFGSSHSDLSAEISAAISSDHLCESQSESSAADYDRSCSTTNDDMRFPSPSSNAPEHIERTTHRIQHYHNIYQSANSTQDYINANNTRLNEASHVNASNDNIGGYIVNTRTQTSNSNSNTPQPVHNQSHHQNLHVSDMSSKSLSGLESLVEQIPTIDSEPQTHITPMTGSVECSLKSDSDERYSSPASGGNEASNAIPGGLGCIYVPTYSNLNSSTPSPSSTLPSSSSIISSHYPDPTYSAASTCQPTPVSNGNNVHYSSLASNFTVSNLTSNSYSPNSYHTDIMASPVVSSPHHVTVPASGNTMYMDSHLPVTVGTIYPHPYAQHAYAAYNPVTPPSPNYPYTYGNNTGYQNQTTHHANHTTPTGYLSSHSSMFDRIKPDIGYGGY